MVTVKDIANEAGVSPSTVSIVLKGNAKQRFISEQNQEKVYAAARRLGYKPNVSAKKLRSVDNSENYIVLVFWASDSRAPMLIRFLNGLNAARDAMNLACEFIIRPYQTGRLEESMTDHIVELSHGAIVCNASENDMEYLEKKAFTRPVALYNRHSSKYSTVTINDHSIGSLAADLFAKLGRNRALVLNMALGYGGTTHMRINSFLDRCKDHGIAVEHVLNTKNSVAGGYESMKAFIETHTGFDCLFSASDVMVFGAAKAMYQAGIRVPDDVAVISVGNGNPDYVEYSIPSISSIDVPIENMAGKILELLYKQLTYVDMKTYAVELPVDYICRESCVSAPNKSEAGI